MPSCLTRARPGIAWRARVRGRSHETRARRTAAQPARLARRQLARVEQVVPSGFPELDRALPGGGWPQGALTELLSDEEGIGELRLLLPALAAPGAGGEGDRPGGPSLSSPRARLCCGGHRPGAGDRRRRPRRTSIAGGRPSRPCAPTARERFCSGRARSSEQRLRRLQLAAQEGEALAFVFATTARAAQPSPSPLRMRLSPAGARLRVDVFKRRGGVMSAPLLLDVATVVDAIVARHLPATGFAERQPARRSPARRDVPRASIAAIRSAAARRTSGIARSHAPMKCGACPGRIRAGQACCESR